MPRYSPEVTYKGPNLAKYVKMHQCGNTGVIFRSKSAGPLGRAEWFPCRCCRHGWFWLVITPPSKFWHGSLKKRVLLTKDSSSCEGVRNTAFSVKVAQRLVDVFNSLGCEGVFLQFCRWPGMRSCWYNRDRTGFNRDSSDQEGSAGKVHENQPWPSGPEPLQNILGISCLVVSASQSAKL